MAEGSEELSLRPLSLAPAAPTPTPTSPAFPALTYRTYAGEEDLASICALVEGELSEPYTIFVVRSPRRVTKLMKQYRYFLTTWPHLCYLACDGDQVVGCIVSKQDVHRSTRRERGYIAMLSIRRDYRKRGIATELVELCVGRMREDGAEEIVLETEVDNAAALSLYERLGFLRAKRLHRFYFNSKSAFRLVLPLPPPPAPPEAADLYT